MTFLYEDLPLKKTTDLSAFSQEAVVPVVYGDMSLSLVAMAKVSDTEFIVDGKVESITTVWINDVKVSGYQVSTEFYTSGEPYTKVTLARAVTQSEKVSCSLRGKVSRVHGRLLENPADIMEDILFMAGITISFDKLRAECATQGIRLAGALTSIQSVQAHLDVVAMSCGAVWSSESARLYPSPVDRLSANFDPMDITEFTLQTAAEGYASRIKVSYDYNYYKGQPSRTMELKAKPYQYDTLVEVSLPMVRNAAIAEAIGRRILTRLSSLKLSVTASVSNRRVTALDWVGITHPELPLDVLVLDKLPLMILSSDRNLDAPTNYLEGEIVIPTLLDITVTSNSYEQRLTDNASVEYVYHPQQQTLEVSVTQGSNVPVEDAKVSVDNGLVYKTSKKGLATIPVAAGLHTLYVQYVGIVSYKVEILL